MILLRKVKRLPCYHPLKAFARTNPETHKKEIAFPMGKSATYMYKNGKLFSEELALPCGQCVGCRLEYSRQWAMRCSLEAQNYTHNYFVTLTYDDEFVPLNEHCKVDKDTGEVIDQSLSMTLNPEHLKEFMKRLRSRFRDQFDFTGIRFFACGEYGPLNRRPHYHIILFNCPIPDLVFAKYANGFTYYRSALIKDVWKKGFVLVTDFSFDTAAYVARYMLKKHKGFDRDYYEKNGIYPEFTRSSRRPGIGFDYLDKNAEKIYHFDEVIIPNRDSPLRVKPPRYYDRLFDIDNPDQMADIKDRRKETAMQKLHNQLMHTDLNEEDYLQVQENNKLLSIKSLGRSL